MTERYSQLWNANSWKHASQLSSASTSVALAPFYEIRRTGITYYGWTLRTADTRLLLLTIFLDVHDLGVISPSHQGVGFHRTHLLFSV